MEYRIKEHPILDFRREKEITFFFNGEPLTAYEGESISSSLHAHGIKVLRESPRFRKPRGLFCAIGKCSSCLMTVDKIPNVRICVTPVKAGMQIETQDGRGYLDEEL